MTDLAPIYDAIRAADKAGDADSVHKLGEYLKSAQTESAEKAQPWKRPDNWKTIAPVHTDYSNTTGDQIKSYGTAIGHALRSEGEGAVDPVVGIGQTVAHVLGAGKSADRFVADREAGIAKERGGESGPDTWRTVGNVMSPINYLGPTGPAGAGIGNALGRVGTLAATGAVVNTLQPVTEGDFLTQKAKQAATGAAGGALAGVGGEVLSAVAKPVGAAAQRGVDAIKRYLGANLPSSLQSAAVHKVLETFGRDEAAGGPKFTEVAQVLEEAHKAGKPLTLADLGGQNVRSLSGYLVRAPGESQTMGRELLKTRDASAAQRLSDDITKHITSGGTMRQTAEALTQARSVAARPLYEEAMKPGSAAPLKESFEAEFGRIQMERAAAQKLVAEAERGVDRTAAKAAQAGQAGDLAMRSADARSAASQAVEQARAKLTALDAQEAKVTTVMREAQRAEAAGERGGVWSPRVQQFLDDPIVKQGIAKGMQVQRLEALAEGRPFNPKDFAVVMGKDGEPVVGAVPNMRLLDSAKRGLDEILEGYRDTTTGRLVLDQRGRAIDQVRQSFVKELDRLNPSYATARASWAGPSQSIDAMKLGADALKNSPEVNAANIQRMTPNEREFAKLGLADKLRERIAKTGLGGDEAKKIMGNDWLRRQIRPFFDSPAEYDKFMQAATTESQMFDTAFHLKGGSHTAERLAGDEAMKADIDASIHGASAAGHVATGNWLGALRDIHRVHQALGWRRNQPLNAEIARLMFDPSLSLNALQSQAGMALLNRFPGPATRNYLQQGFLNAAARAAPAAALMTNQAVNQ